MTAAAKRIPSISVQDMPLYDSFYCIGISHQHTPLAIREQFSLSEAATMHFVEEYRERYGKGIMVLSTCNRTEIYALLASGTASLANLQSLWVKHMRGLHQRLNDSVQHIRKGGAFAPLLGTHVFVHRGEAAMQHLLRVAVGLESQLLGDFEIIGQIKKAFQISKTLQADHTFLDRLVNTCALASKAVKNSTQFREGITSTSFATIHYLKNYFQERINEQRIMLYGVGKIGKNTGLNLLEYTNAEHITFVNRTFQTAADIAESMSAKVIKKEALTEELWHNDVLVVSTAAVDEYTVTPQMLPQDGKKRLLLDLSVPRNIDPDCAKVPNVELVILEEIAQIIVSTNQQRKAEIPKVNTIIQEELTTFKAWLDTLQLRPVMEQVGQNLQALKEREMHHFEKRNPTLNPEPTDQLLDRYNQQIVAKCYAFLKENPQQQALALEILAKIFNS